MSDRVDVLKVDHKNIEVNRKLVVELVDFMKGGSKNLTNLTVYGDLIHPESKVESPKIQEVSYDTDIYDDEASSSNASSRNPNVVYDPDIYDDEASSTNESEQLDEFESEVSEGSGWLDDEAEEVSPGDETEEESRESWSLPQLNY